ncbi:MAG: hypothetical protein BGO06_00650 [Shinella sp. 65-6]|nr:hypothetical protein [Hyphomicrobiales bacterium]OJU85937.1 MAG: hypothetical protein BGO06_00650 [Shinella sp. 65-6]
MNDLDFSQFDMPTDSSAAMITTRSTVEKAEPESISVVGNTAPGSRRYTLLVPLRVDGKWLRHVTLRAVQQGDIDDFGTGRIEGIRAFVCRIADLDPSVFAAMNFVDSAAIHQMFGDMVPEFVLEGMK